MTIPKKKGLRRITVNNIAYYWKFTSNYYKRELKLIIGKVNEPNRRIYLFAKYVDFWIAFPNIDELKDNEIEIIYPKLIERIIKFAIENNYENMGKHKELNLKLENNILYVIN